VVDVTGPAGHVGDALRAAISFAPVSRAWPGWLDSIASACILAGLAAWFEARRDRRPIAARGSAPILVAAFALCHAAVLLVVRVLTYFDRIDERLMSPAVVLGSLAGLLFVFRRLPDDARGFGIALVAYLALVTVIDSASPTMRWRTLNDDTVRNEPFSRAALQATHAGALLLTNDVPRLTWQTRRPTYWLPSLDVLRRFAESNELVVLLEDESAAEPDLIAWLNAAATHKSAGVGYRVWWVPALSTAPRNPRPASSRAGPLPDVRNSPRSFYISLRGPMMRRRQADEWMSEPARSPTWISETERPAVFTVRGQCVRRWTLVRVHSPHEIRIHERPERAWKLRSAKPSSWLRFLSRYTYPEHLQDGAESLFGSRDVQAVDDRRAAAFGYDQAGVLQHIEMPRQRRRRQRKLLCKLSRRHVSAAQQPEDLPPRRIGKRAEHPVDAHVLFRYFAYYRNTGAATALTC